MKETPVRRLLSFAAAGCCAVTSLVLGVTNVEAEPGADLRADLTYTSDWGTGFVGSVVVRNLGDAPTDGWRLEFDLPPSQTVSSAWNADLSSDGGGYVLTNASWTAAIPAGGSVTVGMQGSSTGPAADWTNCLIDGNPCEGGTTDTTTLPDTTTTTVPDTTTTEPDTTTTTVPDTTTTVPDTTTTVPDTTTTTVPDTTGDKRVVGYFTQWSIYGRDFRLKDVNDSGQAAQMTHLNYAFADVSADATCRIADNFADYDKAFTAAESVDGVADNFNGQVLRGNFNQILELKEANPGLRALISLGGWTFSRNFSTAAATRPPAVRSS